MTIEALHNTLRSVTQFHENERLIARLKDRPLLLYLTPVRRRSILVFGAFVAGIAGLFYRNAEWKEHLGSGIWLAPLIDLPIFLGLLYLLYLAATRFRRLPAVVRRWPHLPMHLLFWAALVVLWLTPSDAGPWRPVLVIFALSLPYVLWRCGYMILSAQRGKASGTTFRDHLFYLWPLWGGTDTPYGKGLDFLSQCEATTSEAYARSVLAGMKLLLLALLWEGAKLVIGAAVYGDPKNPLLRQWGGHSLAIPRLRAIVNGTDDVSLFITWLSLYLELIWETLDVASQGHAIIGFLRVFGFNVFRNTYKPLLSESIIDFWSRYYYYFKELMFELFFFPTYLRYFRVYPKLRMLAAVFVAAFAGNTYYHVIQGKDLLVAGQFARIWRRQGPRMLYCFFLALGIYFSMLRQQRQRRKTAGADAKVEKLRKLRSMAGVWTFFSLLNFWSLRSNLSIAGRARFFFSLFGL